MIKSRGGKVYHKRKKKNTSEDIFSSEINTRGADSGIKETTILWLSIPLEDRSLDFSPTEYRRTGDENWKDLSRGGGGGTRENEE